MSDTNERLTTAEDAAAAIADFVLVGGVEIAMDAVKGADDDHAKDFGLGVDDWHAYPGSIAYVALDDGHLYRVTVKAERVDGDAPTIAVQEETCPICRAPWYEHDNAALARCKAEHDGDAAEPTIGNPGGDPPCEECGATGEHEESCPTRAAKPIDAGVLAARALRFALARMVESGGTIDPLEMPDAPLADRVGILEALIAASDDV